MALDIDIPCPKCSNPSLTKARLASPGKEFTCRRCRTKVTFTGDDLRKAQRAVDDLVRTLNSFGK